MTRLSSIFALVLMLLLGLMLGIWVTSRVLASSRIPGALRYGPWFTWHKAGSPDADPYSLAVFARRGDIPMAPAEGIALFANRDSAGQSLSGTCHYEVSGVFPQARAWTLTAYRSDGRLMAVPSGRSAFTSAEALLADGQVKISLSPQPQPGNWLPLLAGERIVLALRFYETPLSAVASVLDGARLPVLKRIGCQS